jgi:hypothetical protein
MNWDAFFYYAEDASDLLELYNIFVDSFSKYQDCDGTSQVLKFRMCVTYGDTSQDFCEANGFKRWTVVGAAMANVCKFESSVKALGEGVYFDSMSAPVAGGSIDLQLIEGLEARECFRPALDQRSTKASA